MGHLLSRAGFSAAFMLSLTAVAEAEAPVQVAKASPAAATRQIVDDWIVACAPVGAGRQACSMSQTLTSKKHNQPVSILMIGKDRHGKLKGSLRMPVGVALQNGVGIRIERQKPFTVPFTACHRIGCFAAFDMTEPLIRKFAEAKAITVVVQSVSQQSLNFNFSGRGWSRAYEVYLAKSK